MSDDARFDPRFDPAFQPGYDGPLAAKPASAALQQPTRATQPPPAPPTMTSAVTPAAVPSSPAIEETVDDRPSGVNPFLVVLGAIAIVLIGGGLFLVSRLRDLYLSTQQGSEFDFVTVQMLIYAAPLVIVLGAATGIGVLFLFALRWRRH